MLKVPIKATRQCYINLMAPLTWQVLYCVSPPGGSIVPVQPSVLEPGGTRTLLVDAVLSWNKTMSAMEANAIIVCSDDCHCLHSNDQSLATIMASGAARYDYLLLLVRQVVRVYISHIRFVPTQLHWLPSQYGLYLPVRSFTRTFLRVWFVPAFLPGI